MIQKKTPEIHPFKKHILNLLYFRIKLSIIFGITLSKNKLKTRNCSRIKPVYKFILTTFIKVRFEQSAFEKQNDLEKAMKSSL